MVGVLAKESAFSVLGNRRLCGGINELGLPKCKETSKFTKKFHLYLIVTLIACALFTTTCLAYAWCKKKRKSHLSKSSTSERYLKVSYSQLLKATNGFSESNLIGTGGYSSVYKGILFEVNDTFVAIKVLHLQNRGAQKSFTRECEAWRNLRHRNLLKIITSCSSIDFQGNPFKALVYEFMPNGSLHDWLHSSGNTSRLNLLQMIKILMDVAYALDYIHNHCLPTIIHGDLKPSNILLDNDMVAHVGDFGLARFLGTSYKNNSTGIRGTVGYIAPEYGLESEMTSNGDIYSFGILVLEAMTGKHPTDDIFNEDLCLHKFASMALLDNVIDIIDVNILNLYQEYNEENAMKIEECLTLTIKIGVACSVDSPTQRMDVKKVMRELQQILDTLENI
ncbi:receptor kinase-like protein Xa21 [Helianthus annuus]|uniref:receptor kinase-like protein Xa21 n=1 Tax=Helianthus annuus TaxID=4232 RepID=UPI000B9075D5|nr:receptor kinase-like protein Xa21 [Helianthus annuus]